MTDPIQAVDGLGDPVPSPPGVDPKRWYLLCRQVVMLPAGGCHLWTGAPRRRDGYGQFWAAAADLPDDLPDSAAALFDLKRSGDTDLARRRPRVWRAHRFAYVAVTGQWIDRDDLLMHLCDQPLCVPLIPATMTAHIDRADNRTNAADREAKGRGIIPGREGRTAWSRGPAGGPVRRSLAIHTALKKALAAGVGRADLAAIVATADRDAAGDDHPTLF